MAPDINSLPTSHRAVGGRVSQQPSQMSSGNASRRTSAIMHPSTHPTSASQPATARSANQSSVMTSSEQVSGHPLRHPRPLTAAELYLECEKEQEAVVNRLTRELTALRAQSASVASNASSISSTSANASLLPVDISDPNPTHQLTGATHPTPDRRHRSSSSVSTSSRGILIPSTNASASTPAQAHGGIVSQASADRAAAAGERHSLNRNPSVHASGNNTPARHSMDVSRSAQYALPHRPSLTRDPSQTTILSMHAPTGTPAPNFVPHPLPSPAQSPASQVHVSNAVQHFADTRAQREELEHVKRENDALRQRVRDLERALRQRSRGFSQSLEAQRPTDLTSRDGTTAPERACLEFARVPSLTSAPHSAGLGVWDGGVGGVAGPRERSESQSTTASSRRGVGVAEDDTIRVGESASSA